MRFVDLFCGIGGFHAAFESKELELDYECVFACDTDKDCRDVLEEWEETVGDIEISRETYPDLKSFAGSLPTIQQIRLRLGFRDMRYVIWRK